MEMREVSAKTVEEAIEVARRELDASREEVEIEILTRGKPGFLGIGSVQARVRAKRIPPELRSASAAIEIVNKLLTAAGTDTTANLRSAHDPKTGGPIVDIMGDDSGLLIGRRGETLRALQFLVNIMVRKRVGDETVRIFLDIERYLERRYTSLEAMAKRVADKVASSGRAIVLEPMPPSERRVVHMALADHTKVETISEGIGETRRVTVSPRQPQSA
jgi:spoIIIJ-associated protein